MSETGQLVESITMTMNEIIELLNTNDTNLTELSNALQGEQQKLKEITDQLAQKNTELQTLQDGKTNVELTVAESAKKLEDAEQKIRELESQNQTSSQQYNVEVENYKKQIQELQDKNVTMGDIQQKLSDAEQKTIELEKEKLETTNNIQNIVSKIQEIKGRVQTYTTNFQQLQQTLKGGGSFKSKIEKLKKRLGYGNDVSKIKNMNKKELQKLAMKLGINVNKNIAKQELINVIILILHGQTGLIKNKQILGIISKHLDTSPKNIEKVLEKINISKLFK